MALVESRYNLFEALAGRSPSAEPETTDLDLWAQIVERLNPARARPVLRDGIEIAHQTTVRGVATVMLRSPDSGESAYVRLTPDELELSRLMNGTKTVAALVGAFARISGRLAPDQVTRVVADLGANRMLAELPIDAFEPVRRSRHRPLPRRIGHVMLEAARGRRLVLANPDRPVGWIYRHGGRFLFTRPAGMMLVIVAVCGLALFARTWVLGADRLLLSGGSFATGGLVLIGLNVVALCCHELGHALAAKHAGRRVPAAGVLLYFGIPSAFVDTTDVWMAGRRARLLTTAAGPAAALGLAGAGQLLALGVPEVGPLAFKLAFAWYLNTLFNLNPLMALDGYYLLMDWVEVPNLRSRAVAFIIRTFRRRPRWAELDREERFVALYGVAAALWLIIAVNLGYRTYGDRLTGVIAGLWHDGWRGRLVVVAIAATLAAPLVHAGVAAAARAVGRMRARLIERRRVRDEPRRLAALGQTRLGSLTPSALSALSTDAHWLRPRHGAVVLEARAAVTSVLAVVDGVLEGRRPGDPVGTVRARAGRGELVGVAAVLGGAPSALAWRSDDAQLLAIPAHAFVAALPPRRTPAPVERAELESLLDETPFGRNISDDHRMGLLEASRPVDVAPGLTVALAGGGDAAVVSAGVLRSPEGDDVRRGALIGPAGDSDVAPLVARTSSRLWTLPAAGGLALLFPGSVAAASSPTAGLALTGAHPSGHYVPLSAPPEPPDPIGDDDEVDRDLFARFVILLVILALLALLLTGWSIWGRVKPWTELPSSAVLVTAVDGPIDVAVNGRFVVLTDASSIHVGLGDRVFVPDHSTATLTFAGGSITTLCGGADVSVGPVSRHGTQQIEPSAAIALGSGRAIADTESASAAFAALQLDVLVGSSHVANQGAATFAVDATGVEVGAGQVSVDGVPVTPGVANGCPTTPGDRDGDRDGDGDGAGGDDRGGGPPPADGGAGDRDQTPLVESTSTSSTTTAATTTTAVATTTSTSTSASTVAATTTAVATTSTAIASAATPTTILPADTTTPANVVTTTTAIGPPGTTVPPVATAPPTAPPTVAPTDPPVDTTATTTAPPPETTQPATTTTAPPPVTQPPDTAPPTITNVARTAALIFQIGRAGGDCTGNTPTSSVISATVADDRDPPGAITVWFSYVLDSGAPSGTESMGGGGSARSGTLGPFTTGVAPPTGGSFAITVFARDTAGNQSQAQAPAVRLGPC